MNFAKPDRQLTRTLNMVVGSMTLLLVIYASVFSGFFPVSSENARISLQKTGNVSEINGLEWCC
jgi:hypothetical protein